MAAVAFGPRHQARPKTPRHAASEPSREVAANRSSDRPHDRTVILIMLSLSEAQSSFSQATHKDRSPCYLFRPRCLRAHDRSRGTMKHRRLHGSSWLRPRRWSRGWVSPALPGPRPTRPTSSRTSSTWRADPCKNDPGITDSEIKIGSIVPVGPLGDVLRHPRRHQGRFAKANAEASGVAARPRERDDGGDTAATSRPQQLVEQEKVFAPCPKPAATRAASASTTEGSRPSVGRRSGVWGTYPNFASRRQ